MEPRQVEVPPGVRGLWGSRMGGSSEIVVPPLNFDMVAPGVYRSGHPNERNFRFLQRLNLRSIVYLANDDYRPNVLQWSRQQGLNVFHHRVNLNKEPFTESRSARRSPQWTRQKSRRRSSMCSTSATTPC